MKFRRLIKVLFIILSVWVLLHLASITIDGLTDTGQKADMAVIMGSKVNEDGTLSTRLEKRLACGLHLYKAGRVNKLLVSGGLGKEGFYEGDKMKAYLLEHGVPATSIIVDNYGNNTTATVENTLQLKDSLHYTSLIVVSQYFHVTRTKMLFRKRGFENVSSVSPLYFEWRDIYSLAREFAAYYTQ
ncbi:YdcF family protein [Rhodocytophaga rosea]|uniref:YdcF family protein n=1 Tax=Rhodocytophaga rosea TaxID=2704465 RepID=A0A6C0GIH4_9BACT|nr:YdcF family protein [Rhodocytophaga rosea]QHT67836.1 YdcF family protein [Rhodocytophaga rosea]